MRVLALTICVLTSAGCYRSHLRASDAGPPIDAPIDVQALSEAGACGARIDAGRSTCLAPTGAALCEDPTCDDCSCEDGVCVVVPGDVRPTWAPEQACTAGRVGRGAPGEWGGGCVSFEGCLEQVVRGGDRLCHYGDGTAVETGEIRCDACFGQESIVCGPGCAACPPDHECLGPSETSGIGFCLPLLPPFRRFFDYAPCGRTVIGPLECEPGLRCLRWATTAAPDIGADMPGVCMAPERCTLLHATRPERFRCE